MLSIPLTFGSQMLAVFWQNMNDVRLCLSGECVCVRVSVWLWQHFGHGCTSMAFKCVGILIFIDVCVSCFLMRACVCVWRFFSLSLPLSQCSIANWREFFRSCRPEKLFFVFLFINSLLLAFPHLRFICSLIICFNSIENR